MAEQTIHLDIVDIEGRAMEGVKFLGMVPEALEVEDFNLYVRWDVKHGAIYVDRSDTDAHLVTVGLARKGKLEAFQNAMSILASRYGADVVVSADPGVKVSALAAKMLGTYAAPAQAEAEISTTDLDASDIAEGAAQAAFEAEYTVPTELDRPMATEADDPFAMLDSNVVAVVARVHYFSKVLVTSAHLFIECSAEHVDAARRAGLITEHDEWLSATTAAVDLLTESDKVDAFLHFNPRKSVDDLSVEELLDRLIPADLPVRTPGGSWAEWDASEMEIWAGTEHLGSMRVRLPRKVKKARNSSKPRPIDVKRARIAKGW